MSELDARRDGDVAAEVNLIAWALRAEGHRLADRALRAADVLCFPPGNKATVRRQWHQLQRAYREQVEKVVALEAEIAQMKAGQP